ncbi:MAG: type III-B CRISPR module RAMP protein Cmr6 [Bryobacterales bacterium]|nr:type III-B CRISPR module RAMP protein Cmr6 [Bryobacterales bacterium]
MVEARREALNSVPLSSAAHAGVVLDYYIERFGDQNNEARQRVLGAAATAASNSKTLYEKAFRRWEKSLGSALTARLKTEGRLIAGLGIETVLETGLRLHHTYGTPIIPGSSIKGVAAHYCAEVWAPRDPQFQPGGAIYKTLFGELEDKGFITFHDAWIIPAALTTALSPDVMTPHYGNYYMNGAAPVDTMNPNPVAFLSVKGIFLIAVETEDKSPAGKQWAELALKLCREALKEWGVGGKTRAGYGRLVGY